MIVWRYKIDAPYRFYQPEMVGHSFRNEWLTITPDGWGEIAKDYAWDGCTPARKFLFGLWMGTPDGPLLPDGRPAAYYASLVHDVFCQFHDEIPLNKQHVSDIFERMLRDRAFRPFLARIYRRAVDLFGPASFGAPHAEV